VFAVDDDPILVRFLECGVDAVSGVGFTVLAFLVEVDLEVLFGEPTLEVAVVEEVPADFSLELIGFTAIVDRKASEVERPVGELLALRVGVSTVTVVCPG